MNSNGRPTGGYTYKDERQGNAVKQARTGQPPRKKKLRFKPNKDGMLALAALVLIAVVVIVLLVLTIKAIAGAVSSGSSDETSSSADTTAEIPVVKAWHEGYIQKSISSSEVSSGELILVNFENVYTQTDAIASKLTALYGTTGHNTLFVLNNADVKVRREIVSNMRDMLSALIAANPETLGTTSDKDRIILSSGYRTTDKQTELYNESVGTSDENLVAKPGYSEHHTGYAIDLKIFTANAKTIDMRENEQAWMEQNCAKYGFVVRYDGSKFEKTGILDESWHYRYVGVPHATYMMENNLCLEEYLELLKNSHAYPNEPLTVSVSDTEYFIYYVPVSSDSTTFVPVPPESVGTYEISGNNVDGFIVTVTKK
ncbi:MAG: M15 family metallopeptidase [Clostridiales bacterium]|nr:M15 family metallopeptidase [Clostridiales bacterium]